ncbi:Major facilitator superfamily domain general substrate transporter [Penicillium fimorum]|uniref:Major facilitator superfamily domain general substrate transporter n=1 Tax=Penicillium fimorum TaxID=1882269 RepID=A0A9W9XP04_9EURO|nr:Major facilitator superfamily domain general substrate transporter [Penicillium fimorum]
MTEEQPYSPAKERFDEKKGSINLNVHHLSDGTCTPSDSDKPDPEAQRDTLSHLLVKNGERVLVTWTLEEESVIVRKLDFLFLPIFSLIFTWMAIDRTNVSSVLTSTFLSDTSMTRDQANTGVSLLWLGIVLLEIPSNIILHRVGPHYWIPTQVIVWGLVEVLQMFVTNASGWYAARLFLGLAESGFIPGGLYILSTWYAPNELTKRTAVFFLGPAFAAAFGSLISAGALTLHQERGLSGWQWIFVICGISTIASGLLAFALLPKSPHHTGHLFGGLFHVRGWLNEHEADILVARQARRQDHQVAGSILKISRKDITAVFFHWATWPYLVVCLAGLQSTNGLSTWGATIIKSLGFSAIRANLLNAPGSLLGAIFGILLSAFVDRYSRFGYAILFSAVWTLAGLIALYSLPITSKASWSFYAAYMVTQSSPNWQPINVTWLSLNFNTPQKRAIAYAIYIGCSNLGGTYGNQVFRASDAPLYHTAWIACISLGAVWLAGVIAQTFSFRWANRAFAKKLADNTELESEATHIDRNGRKYRYHW